MEKNFTTNDDGMLKYVVIPFMIALAIIAFNFLSPWFASFGMFVKLILTWMACEYLYNCIKDVFNALLNDHKESEGGTKVEIQIKSEEEGNK